MRIILASLACILLLAGPAVAGHGSNEQAGPGGHEPRDDRAGHQDDDEQNGHSDRHENGAGDKKRRCEPRGEGTRRGPEDPQGTGTGSRNIHLSSIAGDAPTLTWSQKGLRDACGFKVYRFDPLHGTQLLAVVDTATNTFTDTSATMGAFQYFVEDIQPSGESTTRSNSVTILGGCNWVSISSAAPFVLLHPECL